MNLRYNLVFTNNLILIIYFAESYASLEVPIKYYYSMWKFVLLTLWAEL